MGIQPPRHHKSEKMSHMNYHSEPSTFLPKKLKSEPGIMEYEDALLNKVEEFRDHSLGVVLSGQNLICNAMDFRYVFGYFFI